MDNRTDTGFFRLLTDSYRRLLGTSLIPPDIAQCANEQEEQEAAHWLYESAPFVLLAHNTAADPIFVYGNLAAQRQFGYDWDELTRLPSRLSADTPDQDERRAFIESVTSKGYATGYRGVRIAKSGKKFWIENATLWQLTDDNGHLRGLAAMVPTVVDL
ncbi:MEKHLA domain-containing protein [Trinickia caryophylli]|uniref:PAS domain S-box-containing protein n=1 Tax=Trinickia caryophylli TaxID=28094 RepID=A0A1X7FTC3_TRICW|nr:MEKHLA domain-containing protein [Trinickia caryophylli]PMS11936.1 MEKHLA domain-containing protein [Trinickia caryophylli]TRX13987.1 MEKHLA domain-containing protein [Trinickia caryophylli]WQE15584.1 MEKHLA domain-containing protein [Trinickia caryophylli]SMF58384.1 PAS domain S-box-containing protein [Trinickia caryophylli]GLU33658.1 MEKHLA domain-containing protein [Trinickia caryophylli]